MAKDLNRILFNQAKKYMPGGVNSPVRSFKAVGGCPIFINKANGSRIYSEDGKEFIDYCQSFGALILGHARLEVIKELKEALNRGTTFAACTKLETELAKTIIKAMPSIEKIRLTNCGTEAVMGAIRLARAFTRKFKIIKFKEAYHGHADYLLDCPGVADDFKKYTLTAPYNNLNWVHQLYRKHKKDIAAIIVEPVAANKGIILPNDTFLRGLRKITDEYNSVLIFDEVITGFRLGLAGAQERFGIKPDLTCLGKIIGGGLPAGAFGGRKEIMKFLAPEGNVYQAGTFSGNPLTVSAGLAALRILSETNPYKKLEESTQNLCKGIEQAAKKYRLKIKINFIGSMFSIDTELFNRLYRGLLKEGIYLSPSRLETNFISTAHTDKDLEITLKAIDKVFRTLKGAEK